MAEYNSKNKFNSLGLFIKGAIIFICIALVIYLLSSNSLDNLNSLKSDFPKLSNPKTITYNWEYKGDDYSISQTLYGSVYDYYKQQASSYSYYSDNLPENWQEEYYKMYLELNKEDDSISRLLKSLEGEAESNNLSADETVELILSFVQSLDYDENLADEMLSDEGDLGAKRPYVVLYEKSGTCSGKSFLAYNLLKKFGYGVALFDYESDQHLTVAVKCDKRYSTYESGYCFAETVKPGYPIGIISSLVDSSSQADDILDLGGNNKDEELSDVEIYLKTEGKTYDKVKDNIESW